MGPRKSGASFVSERNVSFELLERGNGSERTRMSSLSDNDWTETNGKLPAKNLTRRSLTSRTRWMFWIGFVTTAIIIGLSFLASEIWNFLPQTDGLIVHSPISCDLSVTTGSAFQSAFTINLRGATRLTFSEAKAIDVIWQLLAGAGGRFVMAWIAYKVFMDGLTRLMEQTPMSYQLYASLTFTTNSLFSSYYATKALFRSKGWRSKFFLSWFGLSTLYMLGFPTLMSATAGYLTPSTAGFNMTDGTFLTANSPELISCYNVTAGALVGYKNGTVFPGPPVSQFDIVDGSIIPWAENSTAQLLAAVPDMKDKYPRFLDLSIASGRERVWDATNSSTPPKIHSLSSSTPVNYNYTSNITIDGQMHRLQNFDFSNGAGFTGCYCYNNTVIEDLHALALCLPESYFVWGFSSLLVYIVISTQIVWFFGMYVVWLDANINSALCRTGRKVRGHFRAAADLSEAAREVLGKQICAYTDEELSRELCMQPGIRYYTEDAQDGDVAHIGLSSRRLPRVHVDDTKLYGGQDKDI